jgi:hypothetical protein
MIITCTTASTFVIPAALLSRDPVWVEVIGLKIKWARLKSAAGMT